MVIALWLAVRCQSYNKKPAIQKRIQTAVELYVLQIIIIKTP